MILKIKLLFLFFVTISVSAKANTLDSLQKELTVAQSDTQKVKILNTIAWEFKKDSLKAKEYLNTAKKIAEKANNLSSIMYCYSASGDLLGYQDHHLAALEQYEKALQLAKKLKKILYIGKTENDIAISYYLLGIYQKALDHFFSTLKFNEKNKNREGLAYSLGNIGNVLNEQGNYKEAIKYSEKALEFYKSSNNKKNTALTLNNIATFQNNLKNYQKAIDIYLQALPILIESNFQEPLVFCYINIGASYIHLGKLDKASIFIEKGFQLAQKKGYNNGVRLAIVNKGSLLIERHRYGDAIVLLQPLINSADIKIQKETTFMLAKSHEKIGQYQRAYKYYTLYSSLKDSLLNETNQQNMARIKIIYEVEQKEKQNELLANENKLQKSKLYASKLEKQVLIALSMVLIVLLSILGMYFNNYKKRKSAKTRELFTQINLLKSTINSHKVNKNTLDARFEIDKEQINATVKQQLNNTDLKILELIYREPTIANKNIATEVFLSTDGVRSSLKKMYTVFNIVADGKNKKLALVLEIINLSKKKRNNLLSYLKT